MSRTPRIAPKKPLEVRQPSREPAVSNVAAEKTIEAPTPGAGSVTPIGFDAEGRDPRVQLPRSEAFPTAYSRLVYTTAPVDGEKAIVANTRGELRQVANEVAAQRKLKGGIDYPVKTTNSGQPVFHSFQELKDHLLLSKEVKPLPVTHQKFYLENIDRPRVPPRLVETELSVTDAVNSLYQKGKTLIVTDGWNAARMKEVGETFVASRSNLDEVDEVAKLIRDKGYERVIGVGGGIALDVAKAVSVDRELFVLPTILSTNCISTNRSVMGSGLESYSFRTATPAAVVVSYGTLLDGEPEQIKRWTQAGYGDMFAEISAAIDIEYRAGNLDAKAVRAHDPEIFEALDAVAAGFDGYGPRTLERLAHLVHKSGLKVLDAGTNAARIGGEHLFYKALMEVKPELRTEGPPHGTMVAIAALISAHAFGEKTGDFSMLETMQVAYEKMRLPFTWPQIEAAGISREDFTEAIRRVGAHPKQTIIGDAFKAQGTALLDKVYGPKKYGESFVELKPQPTAAPADRSTHPILRETGTTWSADGFKVPRAPYHVGEIAPSVELDSKSMPKVFHLPIQKPGTPIRLPSEFAALRPLVQQAIDFEASINPNLGQSYLLLTVDQAYLTSGGSQRAAGLHVDDFQWGKVVPKQVVDHSYVMTTRGSTEFFPQPVSLDGLDESKDNLTRVFYEQIDVTKPVKPAPYSLNLMDSYTIHQAPIATESGFRTFVRLSVSPRKKPGDDSVNVALD